MKKAFLAILILLISLISLISCDLSGMISNGNEFVLYSKDSGVSIVKSENASELINEEAYDMYRTLFDLDVSASLKVDSKEKSGSEIVIGDTSRSASRYAMDIVNQNAAGGRIVFLICFKDDSVAIAASSDEAYKLAFEYFYENYFKTDLSEPVTVSKDLYYLSNMTESEYEEYIEQRAEEEAMLSYENRWDEAEDVLSAEALAEYKNLYETYATDSVYKWMANLYDPETGAFYYANSGRDYIGYGPDLESTYQLLNFISNSGMLDLFKAQNGISNNLTALSKAIPQEMRDKLVSWIKSLQSEKDGYFYHPQWADLTINSTRKGRDLMWATTLLTAFGEKPLYPTATERMSGTASAVAKVIAVNSKSSLPAHLQSEEAFMEYITNDLSDRSVSYGHALSAQRSQIQAAGLGDFLCDYLDSIQEQVYQEMAADYALDPQNCHKPNGLWEKEVNHTTITGLFKICEIYSQMGRRMNYVAECVDSCIEVITGDEPVVELVRVTNPWGALRQILNDAEKANKAAQSAGEPLPYDMDAFYAQTREKALIMLEKTNEKLALFKQFDGSISYYVGYAAAKMHGVPLCQGFAEGDVNATTIGVGMGNYSTAFGISTPPLYNAEDLNEFLSIIERCEPIDKQEVDTDTSYDFSQYGVGDIVHGISFKNNGSSGIEEYNDGGDSKNVLAFNSVVGTRDSVVIEFAGMGSSFTYQELNMRFMITDESRNNKSAETTQIMFKNSSDETVYMMTVIGRGDGKFCICDHNTTSPGTKGEKRNYYFNTTSTYLNTDEWIDLRVEMYVGTEEDPSFFRAKIYVNGEYVATSTNFFGSYDENATPAGLYNSIQISGLTNYSTTMLISEISTESGDVEFVEE